MEIGTRRGVCLPKRGTENRSVDKTVKGADASARPAADLAQMKLSAQRGKDRLHLPTLDAAGLIPPKIDRGGWAPLGGRREHVRAAG